MSEDRWHRLWSIFHSVRETPAGERDAELARLCAGDEHLRGEILALLDADAEEKSALDSPVRVGGDAAAAIPGAGDTIGNYRLVSVIGRGGMGVVYEGLQEQPIRRRVAIKLLRDELSNPIDQARFEAERQALALLSHSHIARVFDGGTAAGHPYFVMEHVEGAPLTAWCDAQKLGIRARVELFIQVCEAVQHAHQRGIIHRDLKPSNIIITTEDGRAIPKIIDFGIAKGVGVRLSSESIQTRAGTLLGTPEYMSPEQAGQSEVDTRSDVYALGTMLYELLCGAIPLEFGEMSLLAALDHIVRSEPPSPVARFQKIAPVQQAAIAAARSTSADDLLRMIRGDLEWIVMKAIEKEPDARYGSAGELASDLRQYLGDRPVMAGPPSGAYRLKKAIRRHRGAAAAAAAIAAAIILGLVGTAWMATVASRERDAAQKARDEARREAAVAKKTAEFVEGMLSAPDPMATAAAVRETKVIDVLGRAEKELAGMNDEPEVAAAFRHTLAKTYHGLGMYPQAQPLLERAAADRLRLLGAEHPATLAAQHDLAVVYLRQGQFEKSQPLIRRTYLARERVLGRNHPDTIASLDQYATDLLRAGELEKAEPLYRDALARSRGALGADARQTLAISNNLAHVLRNRGAAEEAETLQRDVLARRQRLLGGGHPDTINAANTLAMLLYDRGQTDEAFNLYRAAVETYRKLLGEDHSRTLSARNNLAVVLWKSKRYAEAEAQLREILASHARGVGLDGPMALVARNNLARLALEGGRAQEAAQMYRELMPVAEKKMAAKDANLATFRMGYALTLAAIGRRAEAERYMTMAHQQLLDSFGADDKRTQQAAARLAELK